MPTRRSQVSVAAVALATTVAIAAATLATPTAPERAAPPTERGQAGPLQVAPIVPDVGGSERPNIVMIMADDMREDELRYMPNVMQLLGREGVRFENSFSPHPLCCPARASFVSGQYTHNHRVWSNKAPHGGFAALDDSRSLATGLDAVGYNTVFLGKYLNGYGGQAAPDGSADNSLAYVPPGWTDWRGSVDGPRGWDIPDAGGTYRYFDTTLNVNGTLRGNPGVYQTRLLGNETADILAQYARAPEPFFLWASYVAPHIGSPTEPDDPEPVLRPDGYENLIRTPARPRGVRGMYDDLITEPPWTGNEADVSDKPFFIRDRPPVSSAELEAITTLARQRAESLHVLDEEVAHTIEVLRELGELDNTIVAFTSDNGYFLGEHRMRQGKLLPYEPSLRTPTLMRGPGIPAGEVRRDPFLTIDFAPTFLEAAGARTDPEMDGISLLQSAREGDQGWTRAVLTETGPRRLYKGADITEDELLDRPGGPSALRFTQGVRTAHYLYVEHASGERELYDLRLDPEQVDSLVDDPGSRGLVRRLAGVLDGLRDCAGSGCTTPLPAGLQRD